MNQLGREYSQLRAEGKDDREAMMILSSRFPFVNADMRHQVRYYYGLGERTTAELNRLARRGWNPQLWQGRATPIAHNLGVEVTIEVTLERAGRPDRVDIMTRSYIWGDTIEAIQMDVEELAGLIREKGSQINIKNWRIVGSTEFAG